MQIRDSVNFMSMLLPLTSDPASKCCGPGAAAGSVHPSADSGIQDVQKFSCKDNLKSQNMI